MSNDPLQEALFKAVFRLFRPLVRILLRNGIPYGVFAEIAKRAYVEVAANEFGVDGRKQSDSRIATITGLTRKEVRRLKEQGDETTDRANVEKYNRAARVVFGWVHDPIYADEHGNSAVLPFEGEGISFSGLVKAHSGDVPPRAIVDELVRVGVVERLDDGRVRLVARAYIPKAGEVEKLALLGSDVAGLIGTIDRNIHQKDLDPFFQRKVFYDNLPREAIPKLQAMVAERGQSLLESMDQWMAQQDRDVNPKAGGTGRKAAGIGIYYFEDKDFEEQ